MWDKRKSAGCVGVEENASTRIESYGGMNELKGVPEPGMVGSGKEADKWPKSKTGDRVCTESRHILNYAIHYYAIQNYA